MTMRRHKPKTNHPWSYVVMLKQAKKKMIKLFANEEQTYIESNDEYLTRREHERLLGIQERVP